DVFYPLLAERLEPYSELVPRLCRDDFGDANAPRLGERLEARGHVHAVAVDGAVVLLDDLARVEADAEAHASAFGHPFAPPLELGLDLDGRAQCFDDAAEHRQDAVARGVDHASFSRSDAL